MMNKDENRLKKLLPAHNLKALLRCFGTVLGPDVPLAVVDGDGPSPVLFSHLAFPSERIQPLVEAAAETDEIVHLPQGAAACMYVESEPAGFVLATGPLPPAPQIDALLSALRQSLESLAQATLERRAVAHEALARYRELNLLYDLGETLATCLNVDELLQRVVTEATRIIQARQGALLLLDGDGGLSVAAQTHPSDTSTPFPTSIGRALAEQVAQSGKSQIVNQTSITEGVDVTISLLVTPMHTSERKLGAIVLIDKVRGGIFTAGDERLLSALAWQAAIALENARLFDDVRKQRDEIGRMKHYMDNIFASIASGVIVIDSYDILTTFNRAAEKILDLSGQQAINHPYQQALSFLRYTPLPNLIRDVRCHQQAYVAQEISLNLPQGAQRYLSVSLSPFQSNQEESQGVAIVMEDVTDKKMYEHERSMLRRYLPSGLVEQFPRDLTQLGLTEERRVITILFADIRGFTSFSEVNPPERVMDVLNNYLTLAEAAVRFNWGIVDKYMGDAILALFNTPLLEQEDHAWRALRMAWTLREAIQAYHDYISPEEQLFMGFGICTGVVIIGNVGTEGRMEYTAVGDTVNVAKRLQEKAQPGQVLISHETWERVRDRAHGQALPAMRVKGRKTFTRAYEITEIDYLGW